MSKPKSRPRSRQRGGQFITFEGVDGSGKTTQIRRLVHYLRSRNIPVVVTREPGGTRIADRIREVLLRRASKGMDPRAELLLYFASRAENVEKVILPALRQGKVVISDRFTDASLAYQGYGRKLGSDIVRRLHRFVCGSLKPDITFILKIDAKTSVRRARTRNTAARRDESRLEQETKEFFRRVEAGYRKIAREEPRRIRLILGGESPAEVHQAIIEALQPLLRRRGARRQG